MVFMVFCGLAAMLTEARDFLGAKPPLQNFLIDIYIYQSEGRNKLLDSWDVWMAARFEFNIILAKR